MRVACLADGSAWGLVQPEQLARLQARASASEAVGAMFPIARRQF